MLLRPLFTLALPSVVLQILKKNGYTHYEDLLKDDEDYKDAVIEILQKVNYQLSQLQKLVAPPLIDTAGQLLQNEALVTHIPTFSQGMDSILGGGVPSGTLLQVCGGPGSAKTQLLLQLCVSIQLPESFGGLEGASLFIDTECGFTPARLEMIAEGAIAHCRKIMTLHQMEDEMESFNVNNVCNNVHYVAVRNHVELIAAVQKVHSFITEHPKVKLVAIDSIIFPFLTMVDSLERTRLLYMVMGKLSLISQLFNVAVVFTNHLTSKMKNNAKINIPALGETFAHRIPQTLLLTKTDNHFMAVVSQSSSVPQVTVNFNVTHEGIRDTQETE